MAELAIVPATLIWLSLQFPAVGTYVSFFLGVIDVILVLYIINSEINGEYNSAWSVPSRRIPPVGAFLFLIFRRRKAPRRKLQKQLMHELHQIKKL